MLTSPEHTPHTLEPTLNGRGDSSAHALFFFKYLLHNTERRYAVGHVRVDEKNRFCFNCFFHSILTSLLLTLPPRPYTSRACSSKRNLRACRGNCHTLFCCNHQPHACTHHYKHNALSLSRKRREPFFFFSKSATHRHARIVFKGYKMFLTDTALRAHYLFSHKSA